MSPTLSLPFLPNFFFFFNSISNFHFYGDNEARKKVQEYKTRGAPTPPDTIPIPSVLKLFILLKQNLIEVLWWLM
jgi:hypothetical protein